MVRSVWERLELCDLLQGHQTNRTGYHNCGYLYIGFHKIVDIIIKFTYNNNSFVNIDTEEDIPDEMPLLRP